MNRINPNRENAAVWGTLRVSNSPHFAHVQSEF